MNDRNTDTKSIIAQQFDLAEDTFLDEETMIQALALKISHMLEYEIDLLFSTLYRLDILEHKPGEDTDSTRLRQGIPLEGNYPLSEALP